jgi:cell division protein FtsL
MSQLAELDPVLVQPLRRPARPRRKRARAHPQQSRPAVIKTALGIVLAVAAIAFAGRIAGLALQPVMATYRTGQEIRSFQRSVAVEESTNAALREDIAYLRTPAGIEQEARRRGWVKPGEISLSVIAPDSDTGAGAAQNPAPARSSAARPKPAIADRIREWLDTCLAVLGGKAKPQ